MSNAPPLHVRLLFAASSVEGREIANAILKEWLSPPGTSGLRVPVFLTPDDGSGAPPATVPLDAAEHTVVAVLVDREMIRRVDGHGAAWADAISDLVMSNPPGGRHSILLVALAPEAFDFDDRLSNRHFLPLDKEPDLARKQARIEFALAVRALRLLRDAPAAPDDEQAWELASKTEAERVIAASVREALRRTHVRRQLESVKTSSDIVLDVAPEAVWLAWQPADATFLYPDPPLGLEELAPLQQMRPTAQFDTPMRRFARRRAARPALLAVSISESAQLARFGLTEVHERLITDEVHLYLLLAGLRIAYGGALQPDKLDDPNNFTLRLFSLVRSHRDLAIQAGTPKLQPILNFAPWPLWKKYDKRVGDVFGRVAELERVECPTLGLTDAELMPDELGYVKPETAAQRYAWWRALTQMRERMTDRTAARLCIGGKLEGYLGRLPGLVEEPLLSLRAQKPLFLVGALGGCTELVIDLLEQRTRSEMTTKRAREKVTEYDAIAALYVSHGGEFLSRDAVAAELSARGAEGPAAALRNGLDDAENRELFRSLDPARIAELVLTGLERLGI